MSITDELRKWAEDNTLQDTVLTTYPPQHAVHGVLETLLRIADRIDEEHARILRETGEEIVADVRREWMPLPVDADNVPVHIGDVMEWPDGSDEPFEVVGIGDGVLYYLDGDGDALADWTLAESKRHHHATTVEDVLREFGKAWVEWEDGAAMMNPVETFAAKLRLAEGEDV